MLATLALLVVAPKLITIEVDGVSRQATVFAPAGSGKAPVVFGFHGHGGRMPSAMRSFRVHQHWPEAIAVYPQGLATKTPNDPEGRRPGWQFNSGLQGDRDVKFFDALLARLKKDYSVDASRIYAMGHSNGGRFTYVLWAMRGDVFAAFGPSGSPAGNLLPKMKPASAFLIAGEKDRLVSYDAQVRTSGSLKELLGVTGKPTVDAYLSTYQGKNEQELATYFHPGGHEYPQEGGKLTVEFFKRHHK